MSELEFPIEDASWDGAEGAEHGDYGFESFDVLGDLAHDFVDFDSFAHDLDGFLHGEYDLLGADPDEEGLWDHLMLDLDSAVNPFVSN